MGRRRVMRGRVRVETWGWVVVMVAEAATVFRGLAVKRRWKHPPVFKRRKGGKARG